MPAESLVRTSQDAAALNIGKGARNEALPKGLKKTGKMGQTAVFDPTRTTHTSSGLIPPTFQEVAHFGQLSPGEALKIITSSTASLDGNEPERLEWAVYEDEFRKHAGNLLPGGPPRIPPPEVPMHDEEPGSPRAHARRVLLSVLGGRAVDGAFVGGFLDMIETRRAELYLRTPLIKSVKKRYTTRLQTLSEERQRRGAVYPGYQEGIRRFEDVYEAYTQAGQSYTNSGKPTEEHFEQQLDGINLLADDYRNLSEKTITGSNGRKLKVVGEFVPAMTDGQWGELEGVPIQQPRHTLWCGYTDVSAMLQYQGYTDQTQEAIFRGMHGPYFYEQENSMEFSHQSPAYGYFAKYGEKISNGELKASLSSYKSMAKILETHPDRSPLAFLEFYLEDIKVPVMIRIPGHNILVVGFNFNTPNPYYTVIDPAFGARRTYSPKTLLEQWAARDLPDYPYDGRYQMLAFRPQRREKSL